ncbi:ribonuclease Z [Evansella cellulosilytica]|uniref:Ribonuclease Z n=1 Tax=Evansella cellulosilytica (strain ATCC 21833 / DSM 2522 / FERM P-1141 / JCM 9156 / N-4) TaxID=649639 RepID=E6TZ30_EVAC2|nr:ribonuclease Z [Evansella cellulosilytica]ADU32473.1 ribonuclease Z [Evansella cellulosilytica DSM 2522]
MKVTFLGTGAGIPAKERNVSSIALHLHNDSLFWLFDCGEATQHQILHTPIKLRKINSIFISHLHGDHIFGLPGLLGSRSFQGAETPLTVYGPVGIQHFIETSLKVSTTYLKYPIHFKELENDGVIYEDNEYIVTTQLLEHGIDSYGFRVDQKEQAGSLLMDKVVAAGIPPGPILKDLKVGRSVTLQDGRVFHGEDFIGPPKKGKSVAVLGDTRFSSRSIALCKGVHTLVHEATFAHKDEQIAHEYFHATTEEAAKVAKLSRVEQLILTHISSRYQKDDMKQLLLEAKEVFPQTYIAEDLKTFQI